MVTRAVPGSYVCDFKIHHTPEQIQMRGYYQVGLQWRMQERVTYEREREREMKWWEQQR